MRLLAGGALLLVAVLILVVWMWYLEHTRKAWVMAEVEAQWEGSHYSKQGVTYVVVHKVAVLSPGQHRILDSISIAEITDSDPEWDKKFAAAQQKAYDRAITLNYPV